MKVVLFDHDTFSADDLIGEGFIKKEDVAESSDFSINLLYKNKPAGVLNCGCIFESTEK